MQPTTVQDRQAPLAGLRVLDLSRVLAGPWCSQILGDLGADVVKVERPVQGDDTRHWGPPWVQNEAGETVNAAYFLCANRNKRSITLDLASPDDAQTLRELAARADVVLENFKVGGLAAYGLGAQDLMALNPRLVVCAITGFGQSGPLADRAGYDFLIQGMGGLMSVTGQADGEPGAGPLKTGVALVDVMTGLYAAIAIQSALIERARSGLGQFIDMALLDVQVAALANQAAAYLVSGQVPVRRGNAHPSIVPYQDVPTLDGDMILAVGNDGQFERLCVALGQPQWAQDDRFVTNGARVKHRLELMGLIAAETRRRTTAEWVHVFESVQVPCGPINRLDEVFAEPQVQARGMRVDMFHSSSGVLPLVANPMHLSATPVSYRLPPPQLGEHTQEVLKEWLALSKGSADTA